LENYCVQCISTHFEQHSLKEDDDDGNDRSNGLSKSLSPSINYEMKQKKDDSQQQTCTSKRNEKKKKLDG